ncbi:constitutive coactivator of peroxisome proliferator-activated receptor gamma-like isoform X2 [Argiope bruennichi]|uniref:constitutive coactivator of peroxisome proliferator-activated receptor gamma-like isoform X2 n=1 Tax=Argiope bruennichi TaxID=94029 RepID=UPI002494060A|nr:constitutive coactivator of peroxisome proliferator-activated receptor gamma-like isoform X2 [Argiope bruennichi]
MERTFVERAPSPTEQELLLRVITPTKRTMPGAQTPRTGSYQNRSGKGEMSSLADDVSNMEIQQGQGNPSEEEIARNEASVTVPRPISPTSIQVTDEFIAEHSLEITQAISLKENLGNWAQALAAATSEDQHTQVKKEIQQVLEDGSRMASALVYREIRQRCYGILFNCFVEPGSEDSIVIEERCWYKKNQNENNNLREPERIHPLPLRSTSDLIKIEDLWFGCSEKRRFEFFWHILQIPMEFDILMQLPEDQVAISCILNYLIGGLKSGPLLEPLDVAAFVAQAVWKPSALDIKQLENPQVCPSTVNLSTLFVNGIEPVLMALETCGFPSPYKYTLPWQFFDGKLFHFLHNEAKNRPRVRVLCNDQDEIVKRFYQLLPVVTSRTEYDPERFEWRNILKDFYLEQNIKS